MQKRRIAVVTGSRADLGHLLPVMGQIASDPALQLQVIATGMHLVRSFGDTWREIEAAGFAIDARVDNLMASDEGLGVAKSIGVGVLGFSDALERLRPDVLLVLGDRFEIFAAVSAAMALRIPVAHLHGGEVTYGAMDEAIRHAITKMAHLHFVSTEAYRRRVIQLGESPGRVFNFGAPGLDAVRTSATLSREQLEERLGVKLGGLTFLSTYHPATLDTRGPAAPIAALCAALEAFPEATVIFTKTNADQLGSIINAAVEQFATKHPGRVHAFTSLGSQAYMSLLRQVQVVVGNSSSGLYEAPFFRVPTVNLGDRQAGRFRPESVIDCPEETDAIIAAIRKALSPAHQQLTRTMKPCYGEGHASEQIKDTLRSTPLEGILVKRFHDLEAP